MLANLANVTYEEGDFKQWLLCGYRCCIQVSSPVEMCFPPARIVFPAVPPPNWLGLRLGAGYGKGKHISTGEQTLTQHRHFICSCCRQSNLTHSFTSLSLPLPHSTTHSLCKHTTYTLRSGYSPNGLHYFYNT